MEGMTPDLILEIALALKGRILSKSIGILWPYEDQGYTVKSLNALSPNDLSLNVISPNDIFLRNIFVRMSLPVNAK
jgi:hypothetical protein